MWFQITIAWILTKKIRPIKTLRANELSQLIELKVN